MGRANPFFKGLAGMKTLHTHLGFIDESQSWDASRGKGVVGEKCSSCLATSQGQLCNLGTRWGGMHVGRWRAMSSIVLLNWRQWR